MKNNGLISISIKTLFISGLLLNSLPAFSSSSLTSERTFAEGDYTLNGTNGLIATGGGYDNTSGGADIDTSYLANGGSIAGVSGFVGSDLEFISYNEDQFFGQVSSGARVSDPFNQLALVQADGEAGLNFSFEIATEHTYTLTGNTSIIGGGRLSILFDSVEFTQLDDTFSLSGTLAAGTYSFSSYSIAALSDIGRVNASYDFDLQLYDVSAVPVPAAFWLFGSGLIGLAGLARKRK